MIIALISLLLFPSVHALDANVIIDSKMEEAQKVDPFPHKNEVAEQIKTIYTSMIEGKMPTPGATPEFFSGQCVTDYSAAESPQSYISTLAIRTNESGQLELAYTTGQGPLKNYSLSAHGEYLQKMYVPKLRPYKVNTSEKGGVSLDFTMAPARPDFSEIHAFLSMDSQNNDLMYFIAPLMGFNCKLTRVY